MPTKRDYYEVLGLPRTATEDDVKKAYRRLAREYHPDVNKSEGAEKRFSEISEAYEVLSDAAKRSKYDQFGHSGPAGFGGGYGSRPGGTYTWSNVGGSTGSAGSGGAQGFDPDDIGSIFEEVFGVGGRSNAGSSFGGRRASTARARSRPARGEDITLDLHVTFMTAVKGGTESVRIQRGGVSQTIDITVPPGIEDGKKLRIRGAGHPAKSGVTTGVAGDLIATVHIGKHPHFRRDPARPLDILIDLPLTIAEATLGTTVNVPLLKGS
ncbi:MAG: DnaJ domain-containing protein, partial [Phycisphaerales bacterium]